MMLRLTSIFSAQLYADHRLAAWSRQKDRRSVWYRAWAKRARRRSPRGTSPQANPLVDDLQAALHERAKAYALFLLQGRL